jgi:hypothetical protein
MNKLEIDIDDIHDTKPKGVIVTNEETVIYHPNGRIGMKTVSEYKKEQIASLNKEPDGVPMGVKCESCDGEYLFIAPSTKCVYPPLASVKCNKCGCRTEI